MKLTKAQRLFVAVGQAQNELMLQKAYHAQCDADQEESGIIIKEYKALRKRLLREALKAARSENTEHYMNGINEVLRQIGR